MDSKQLGQTVRYIRKEQGLTQQQLAATSAVGVRFVRELEQGKASCHIGKVMTVLEMLGIRLQVEPTAFSRLK